MKFSFRFASVLKLRRHQEKMEKQKLGNLIQERNQLKEALENLEEQCLSDDKTMDRTTQTVTDNRQYYAQKHAMHKRLVDLRQELAGFEEKIAAQRQKLTEANTQTRIMEKLKQNEKRAFIQRVEELEQLQQNEIAIQRYNAN